LRRLFSGSTALLVLALALIAGATLTPSRAGTGEAAIVWCLTCGPTWLTDVFTNVALFVPLGVALVVAGTSVSQALLLGSLVSLSVEALQHVGLPAGRTPALSDWITNSVGTLAGALVWHFIGVLRAPTARAARMLTLAWSTVLLGALLGTSWALSPRYTTSAETARPRPSALPFAPGYGWFAAWPDSAEVNGTPVVHGGNGPVIVEASITDTMRASVRVRGRDARRGVVPIVFVHSAGSRSPALVIGQRGDNAIVRSTLMGRRVGLATPDAVAREVFAERSTDSLTVRQLSATVMRGRLEIDAQASTPEGSRTWQASVVLSPAIGWTMIQSVVRLDSRAAPALSVIWIVVWFAMGGFWASQTRGSSWTALAWASLILAMVFLGTAALGMPGLSALHSIAALAAAFGASRAPR
jgi:hypothetical protein